MISRRFMILAFSASTATGVGMFVLPAADPGEATPGTGRQDVRSITGVGSGVAGAQAKQPEKKGVDQVTVPPEPPATTAPAPQTAADRDQPQSQTADIEGVKGTAGTTTEPEMTSEIYSANAGSMQSVRGIKGIDTVMLQNLEAVLRMQAPPPPSEDGSGGGGVRAAAALLTMENDESPEPEEESDDREELTELELEGS